MIRFEARSFLTNYLKYGHLAISAKLHGPKGGRINESLLYNFISINCKGQTKTKGTISWLSFRVMTVLYILSRVYKEKRACNSQYILCMRHITDESAGYAIFSPTVHYGILKM